MDYPSEAQGDFRQREELLPAVSQDVKKLDENQIQEYRAALKHLVEKERMVYIPIRWIDAIGDMKAAALFQHLVFFSSSCMDDEGYIHRSQYEIWLWTRLSGHEQRQAKAELKAKGLLTEVAASYASPTRYMLNVTAFLDLLDGWDVPTPPAGIKVPKDAKTASNHKVTETVAARINAIEGYGNRSQQVTETVANRLRKPEPTYIRNEKGIKTNTNNTPSSPQMGTESEGDLLDEAGWVEPVLPVVPEPAAPAKRKKSRSIPVAQKKIEYPKDFENFWRNYPRRHNYGKWTHAGNKSTAYGVWVQLDEQDKRDAQIGVWLMSRSHDEQFEQWERQQRAAKESGRTFVPGDFKFYHKEAETFLAKRMWESYTDDYHRQPDYEVLESQPYFRTYFKWHPCEEYCRSIGLDEKEIARLKQEFQTHAECYVNDPSVPNPEAEEEEVDEEIRLREEENKRRGWK